MVIAISDIEINFKFRVEFYLIVSGDLVFCVENNLTAVSQWFLGKFANVFSCYIIETSFREASFSLLTEERQKEDY